MRTAIAELERNLHPLAGEDHGVDSTPASSHQLPTAIAGLRKGAGAVGHQLAVVMQSPPSIDWRIQAALALLFYLAYVCQGRRKTRCVS